MRGKVLFLGWALALVGALLPHGPALAANEPSTTVIFDHAPAPSGRPQAAPAPAPITVPGLRDGIVRPPANRYSLLSGAPPAATAKILVLAVDFSDVAGPASMTRSSLGSLVLGTGTGSVRDYYAEVSYGGLSLTGAVEGPTATTLWFHSTHTQAYYGTNGTGTCPYEALDGFNDCVYDLTRELVKAADAAGLDFAPYDADGDGFVDHLIVVQGGGGEELGGASTKIWSHRWSVLEPHGSAPSTGCGKPGLDPSWGVLVDGKCVFAYTMQGSDVPMGTFAHEFGHDLGLPDLYDTSGSSEGVGEWDIMGSGGYNGTPLGSKPAHMSAHSKMKLGWLTPTSAVSGATSLPSVETTATALKVPSFDSAHPGDYFLIENRQKTGFDAAMKGSGLLIWHVDDDWYTSHVSSNSVNVYGAAPHHRGLMVEEADIGASHLSDLDTKTNRSDANDPYYSGNPAAGYDGSFGPSTTPASLPWSGSQITTVAAISIGASGATMPFTIVFGDSTPPVTTLSYSGTPGTSPWFKTCGSVTLTASDPSGVTSTKYTLDGGALTSYSSPFSVCGDGTHTVTYFSTDAIGNVEPTHSLAIKVDRAAPVVTTSLTCTPGSNGWCHSAASVGASATDALSGVSSLTCKLDGAPGASPPISVSTDGSHSVACTGVDVAGNAGTATQFAGVDRVAPSTTAALSGTSSGGWYRSDVTVTLTGSDTVSGIDAITANIDGAGDFAYGGAFPVSGDGTHTVTYFATDVSGNVESVKSVTFKIDTTPGTGTIVAPSGPAGLVIGATTLRATAADAGSGVASVAFLVDGAPHAATQTGDEWQWAWTPGLLDAGPHQLALRVTDVAGNVSAPLGAFEILVVPI